MVVSFYKHHDYKGYGVHLNEGEYNTNDLYLKGILNNDLSSLKIESGNYIVYLYSGDNFTGKSYSTTTSIPKFVPIGWNDITSSIKIINNNAVYSTAPVPNSPNIYNSIRDSIVTILGVTNDSKWTGSGFFIKKNNKYYIVTVAHNVIISNRNTRIPKVVAAISNTNNTGQNTAYQCRIIGIGGLADVAVLEVIGNVITNQTYLNWGNSRNTSPGDTCYILGDPKGVDAISITKGVVRDNKFTYNNSIELISSDAQIASGNSGSPVVDDMGHVIGILSFSFGDSDSLSAGASQYIMEYIVNNIIESDTDYIGKVLDINARPVDVLFLERYNLLPGNLEGYYLSRLNNTTFTYNSMDIISGVKINDNVYKIGVYNNQYPLSSFVYNNPNSTILLEIKNLNTNIIRYESVTIKSISIDDDTPDGNIIKNIV